MATSRTPWERLRALRDRARLFNDWTAVISSYYFRYSLHTEVENMNILFGSGGESVAVDLLLCIPILAVLAIVWCMGISIYNVCFHPLSTFPGPKLWSTSFIFRHMAAVQGRLDWDLLHLHERYGPVVRYSPDELSFISDRAWKDIYGNQNPALVKDPGTYNLEGRKSCSIFNADEHTHPRMRKQLAHAFSARALREQEPQVISHVDLLMEHLKASAQTDETTNLVDWYNFTTFDMIGDLTISKSFDTLQTPANRSWTEEIWLSIKIGAYYRAVATYINPRRVLRLIEYCLPSHLTDGRDGCFQFLGRYSQERIAKGVMEESKDFLSYVLKNQEKSDGLTDEEIAANCGFLVVAGSETTATALSGMTWLLLHNPNELEKLTVEIRGAFASEDEMTATSMATRLPYTMAVIQESLRLYPSAPTLAPRRTARGRITTIDGCEVPGWTNVGVHALAASRSATNFHRPLDFVPERWLPESIGDPASPYCHDRRGASQPFSLGPRACLGKSLALDELRLIIAKLFWKFEVRLCEESRDWGAHQATYGLWAKPPLMCKLREIRKGPDV